MLVLYETAAGFALFKVLQEGKVTEATDLWKDFQTLDAAQQVCMPSRKFEIAAALDRSDNACPVLSFVASYGRS